MLAEYNHVYNGYFQVMKQPSLKIGNFQNNTKRYSALLNNETGINYYRIYTIYKSLNRSSGQKAIYENNYEL